MNEQKFSYLIQWFHGYDLSSFTKYSRGAQLKSHGWPLKIPTQSFYQTNQLFVFCAQLKASTGHIKPPGRMLCMPALQTILFKYSQTNPK